MDDGLLHKPCALYDLGFEILLGLENQLRPDTSANHHWFCDDKHGLLTKKAAEPHWQHPKGIQRFDSVLGSQIVIHDRNHALMKSFSVKKDWEW